MERRSSTSAATRSNASTTCGGSSSTSPAGTPTCTAASSSSRTTTAPTSASCSSTTRATRPPAATGPSRSSPGPSTRASWSGAKERTTSSSTCPPAASTPGREVGGRPRAVGALPERSRVRLGRGRRARGANRRPRLRRAFYASVEERVEPSELPRLIELGRELKREIEAWQEVAPPPLEPELRDVYGVIFWQEEDRGPADATQRHGLRGRRGRSLPVWERYVGAARPARPLGTAAAGRGASPPEHRRHGVPCAAW